MTRLNRACALLTLHLCLSEAKNMDPPSLLAPSLSFVPLPAINFTLGEATVPLPSALTLGMSNRQYGDADEWPRVPTSAGGDVLVAMTEVTNVLFEQYQPAHAALRGKYGFSVGDNEAVVFVTWYDAAEYCVWLSDRDNATYRLPTEAEAEAYIRAGTSTYYSTGDSFPYGKNQCDSWWPGGIGRNDTCDVVVNLTVASFPANQIGIYDAHGNVEEWTGDWYNYYAAPNGGVEGDGTGMPFPLPQTFRVTRGGSHSADVYHLRSAARAGSLAADSSWYIGIRVVKEAAPGNRAREWLRRTACGNACMAAGAACTCTETLREAPVRAAWLLARDAADAAGLQQHGAVWAELGMVPAPAAPVAAASKAANVVAASDSSDMSAASISVSGRRLGHRNGMRQQRRSIPSAAAPATASAALSVDPAAAAAASSVGAASSGFFAPPLKFVHVDTVQATPFTQHNHDPALAVLPSGDVFATWFSTITEPGRESSIVYSRLRLSAVLNGSAPASALAWEPARLFYKTPRRMDCCPIMYVNESSGEIIHIHGVSAAATWGNTALVMRRSSDGGESWSFPFIIAPEHYLHHQPINSFFRCRDGSGRLVFASDNVTVGSGGTVLHFSADNGATWSDDWNVNGEYALGIHAGVVQLANGSFLAFGRGNDIDGMMAQSRSDDGGLTWAYSASPFPGIVGGQRGSHIALADGSLMMCTFANAPIPVPTTCGGPRNVTGLYCARSTDNGDSWPTRRLVTEGTPGALREQLDGVLYVATATAGEQDGYTVARQGEDGIIHLITSRQHYRFDVTWLASPAPC